MRVVITGEKGFIASNLLKSLNKYNIELMKLNLKSGKISYPGKTNSNDEMCVYRNTIRDWTLLFETLKIDMVIHNAAVVGTDVVALDPNKATLTNVAGTYNIIMAANAADIPIIYLGTTVMYNTKMYQDGLIYENSHTRPITYYGHLKLMAENLITHMSKKWIILRPLFAYGGVGDMNSLIAKTFYASMIPKKLDMFLDPENFKDYLHVEDFCDAVALACKKKLYETRYWPEFGNYGNDYNIAAETPLITSEVVELMSDISKKDLNLLIDWKPETDYLGNHRLSTAKFRTDTEWLPKITLEEGLSDAYNSILKNSETGYNPLIYLEQAKESGVDLTKFY